MLDGGYDLSYQATSLFLPQPFLLSHVRMQVAIVTFKEDVGLGLTEYDFRNTADVFVRVHLPVSAETFSVSVDPKNLKYKSTELYN